MHLCATALSLNLPVRTERSERQEASPSLHPLKNLPNHYSGGYGDIERMFGAVLPYFDAAVNILYHLVALPLSVLV